jgi:hypothetical protein
MSEDRERAREVGDKLLCIRHCWAIARFARSALLTFVVLGFRFAPPQALCLHPLRGFYWARLHWLVHSFFQLDILRETHSLRR